MSLFEELKRRNVFRVGVAYLVIGWLVLQVTNTLVPVLELPPAVGKFVFLILFLGFFPALLFAWAYELTPEGLKKEKDVDRTESVTPETAKKLDIVTLIALLVIGVMIVWQQVNLKNHKQQSQLKVAEEQAQIQTDLATRKTESKIVSIAVLPFADMSPEGDQEYFSDGMAEEILNVLVRMKDLKVASRTSSFQFKGKELGIPEIAKKLNVRYILEGSVRKAGETLRITGQLIEAETDLHLWSNTYDRPLSTGNIFAIQDEISSAIVEALSAEIGIQSLPDIKIKNTTNNLTAYELYLKARPLFLSRQDLDKADQMLIQALELDPDFANAWEMRAALQSLMEDYGYSNATHDVIMQRTEEYVGKALALDPESSLAIATLAKTRLNATQELRGREDIVQIIIDYQRALGIDPKNASTLNWLGLAYAGVGDLPAALESFQQCIDYEPLYHACVDNYNSVVADLGRDQEALQLYKRGLDQGLVKLKYINLGLLVRNQEELLFKAATSQPDLLLGWRRHGELYKAHQNPSGDHKELIDDILKFSAEVREIHRFDLATLLVPIGAYDLIPPDLYMWGKSYHHYRQSSQFKDYIKGSGILDYWQRTEFPGICRAIGMDDFECD